jgi:hypothetical protein
MGQFTTKYIRDSYSWQKMMRMKGRWRPGPPRVMAVVGAELVRVTPEEAAVAQPEPAPEPEEAPKGRRGRHADQTS